MGIGHWNGDWGRELGRGRYGSVKAKTLLRHLRPEASALRLQSWRSERERARMSIGQGERLVSSSHLLSPAPAPSLPHSPFLTID